MILLSPDPTDLVCTPRPRCVATILLSVFCVATTPALAQDATKANAQAETDEAAFAPMCKTDLRLSGAVFNAKRPERSFALFETQASHNGWVYRIGARIGAFELVEVAPRGALLRGPEGECWLQLIGDPPSAHARAQPSPRSKRPNRPKKPKNAKKTDVVVIGSRSR
jgi:hypothetical protein